MLQWRTATVELPSACATTGSTHLPRTHRWVDYAPTYKFTLRGLRFSQELGGECGLRIRPLFGTTNQLVASLTLMILAVMFIRKRRNPWPVLIPLVIVFAMSFWAAIDQLFSFATPGSADWLLFIIDCIIISSVFVAFGGIKAIIRARKEPPESEGADVSLEAVREGV